MGEILWTFTFGQTGDDKAWSVIVANDGSTLVAGSSDSTAMATSGMDMVLVHAPAKSGSVDMYVIKTGRNGGGYSQPKW